MESTFGARLRELMEERGDTYEQLGERLGEARRDAATKNRLYVTLGVTGGIGLALLLL